MGLTQGFTELFPVSSLGHSVLLPGLLGWHNLVNSQSASESFFLAFIVGLHVGTALGLLVFYRKTWIALFRGLGRQLAGVPNAGVSSLWHLNEPDTDPNYRLLFVLAVATVPVGIAGILLEHKLRVLFAKPLAAAIFLTINGVILLVGEEDRRGEWLREEDAQFVLQQDAGNPDRHRGDGEHEQQSVVRIGVGFVEVPERRDTGIRNTRQLSAETAKERDPRLAIKHEESEGRAHVQSDDEGEEK